MATSEAAGTASSTTATSSASAAGRRPGLAFSMSCEGDEVSMSHYQCTLRRHIEFFAATEDDLKAKAQGRNVKIRLGQVGIRCRHCGRVPPDERGRGSVYFPAKLASLYQAVQNISSNHFKDGACRNAPPGVVAEIDELRRTRPKHSGGLGKRYFSQSAASLGIVDAEGSGLELANAPSVNIKDPPPHSSSTTSDEPPPSPSSGGPHAEV
jgi:hypothetical protein